MLIVVGLVLLVFGLVAMFFGDRQVGGQGGWILRGVSWPAGKSRWLKIPMGVALIAAGVLVLVRAMDV